MMYYEIKFNQTTSVYASKDQEANLMYLRLIEKHVNDLLKIRGYVYSNQIYEELGIRWDPTWSSYCLLYKYGRDIKFDIRMVDDGFEVVISM